MNILKRVWKKFRDYQDNPTINDCPDAPDVESVGPMFDQQVIQEQLNTEKDVSDGRAH